MHNCLFDGKNTLKNYPLITNILKNDIGFYIRYKRIHKGYSCAKFCEILGISERYLYKIEEGECCMNFALFLYISFLLDININSLIEFYFT